MTTISVVIPTFPLRRWMLTTALDSVWSQTRVPDQLVIQIDNNGEGACGTRNKGIEAVTSEWTAFLDDDDFLYPQHIEHLLAKAEETHADFVYPWFDGQHSSGLLAVEVEGVAREVLGVEFGEEQAQCLRTKGNFIPVTCLVRTELIQGVGGFSSPPWASADNPCEDWGCWIKLLDVGAKFVHLPERTWRWNVHGKNTSGRVWTQCGFL